MATLQNIQGVDYGVFTPGHLRAPYQEFGASSTYSYSPGVIGMPLAEPDADGSTVRVVTLHQRVSVRVYSWAVSRKRERPLLPDPEGVALPGEVLSSVVVNPQAIARAEDGRTPVYSVTGVYTYIVKKPVKPGQDTLQGPGAPYDSTGALANQYGAAQFTKNLKGG